MWAKTAQAGCEQGWMEEHNNQKIVHLYGQARATATTKTTANGREKTSPCSACCCGIGEKGRDKHGQRVSMERGIVTKNIQTAELTFDARGPGRPKVVWS